MTAKRGSQWKSSWRRTGPALGTGPDPMYFFNTFRDNDGAYRYEQALTAPSIGSDPVPFWVGTITGALCLTTSESVSVARGAVWNVDSQWNATTDVLTAYASLSVGTLISTDIPPYNPPLWPFQVRAIVTLLTVQAVAGGFRETLWVDGNVRAASVSVGPYAPGLGVLAIDPSFGLLNGVVGGNSLVTDDEVRAWFAATRTALAVQEIPGKTTDRFDAGATPGVVPDPLVNLVGGGQDAPLVASGGPFPTPLNTLFQATFGY